MQRSIHEHLDPRMVVAPQSLSSGETTGEEVDLRGSGAAAVMVVVGSVTSDGVTVTLEHADADDNGDPTGWEEVSARDIDSPEDFPLTVEEGHEKSVIAGGYLGSRRFLRAVADASSGEAQVSVMVVRGYLSRRPSTMHEQPDRLPDVG